MKSYSLLNDFSMEAAPHPLIIFLPFLDILLSDWSWGTEFTPLMSVSLFHFFKVVAVRDLGACVGFFFSTLSAVCPPTPKGAAVKPVEWGLLLISQEISRLFLMTAMGKIDIISSADPLLDLLLVARKFYI